MATTAGDIVTRVRDAIPDPVYNAAGVAQPNSDGRMFRASTLYRWLDDGITSLVQRTGWVVEDWYAMSVASGLPFYSVDPKWVNVENAYKDAWRLARVDEQITIWPQQTGTTKSLWFSTRRVTDHWEITFFPYPTNSDPTETLAATLNLAVTVATLNGAASTNWLPYGFVQIDDEILYYGQRRNDDEVLDPLSRGRCGTSADTHNNGSTVRHLSLWFKGHRLPLAVSTSSSVVEIPPSFVYPLQDYVLARCRNAENEFQESRAKMAEFNSFCETIRQDPGWKENQGHQTLAYGEPVLGPLAFGRVVVPILVAAFTWWML